MKAGKTATATTSRETAATASFISELVADGMVERQAEVLVRRESDREYMVELRLLDVTNASEDAR